MFVAPKLLKGAHGVVPRQKDFDVEAAEDTPSAESNGNKDGGGVQGERCKEKETALEKARTITFDSSTEHHPKNDAALYIPSPRDRDQGATSSFSMAPQCLFRFGTDMLTNV